MRRPKRRQVDDPHDPLADMLHDVMAPMIADLKRRHSMVFDRVAILKATRPKKPWWRTKERWKHEYRERRQ